MAVAERFILGPGSTVTFLATTCPRRVSFVSMDILTKGTVAEYSVGLVMFTFAPSVMVDLVVSRILRPPT